MGTFFHPDNKFFQIVSKFMDVLILSLLWFFVSLPIITLGASTTAMYYAVNKSVFHNTGYAWQVFWEAFKSNFKQSTIAWILSLSLYVLAVVDYFILRSLLVSNVKLTLFVFVIMVALVLIWNCYVFPCIARYENTTKLLFRNALLLALCNLPWTLLLVILLIIGIVLFIALPPLIAVIPGGYACLARIILERIFKKYTTPEDLAAEEERFRQY